MISSLLSNPWIRPIVFGAGLALMAISGFAIWSFFIFILLAFFLYFWAPRDKHMLRCSFWSLAVFTPAILWLVIRSFEFGDLSTYLSIGIILVSTALFWVVEGLMRFRFENRFFVYNMVNTTLLVLVSAPLLALASPSSLSWTAVVLFIALFLNLNEAFEFFGMAKKRRWALAGTLSLIGLEVAWMLSLLTLGVVNSSVFLVLVLVLARDIFVVHHQGNLSLNFIFRQLTFLVFLTVIIFATSQWTL